ncbi:transglutaminase superfamily protein [Sediminihabitans luteus]|uniref:Transglutaminase superfamily protein n=1 Tax=Sediminihabitans luteus TaxID=1138585 RepID=A0A2M9CEP9_9CELL|nr:transglutaminase domain-containing protein [Sediminihabitans luteus]PJJ70373.1 transglutaminase superfamily protein [Sediminihabitans luteus]GII97845.1 hypothetical protein Slu03_02230 [Sediminihabitans luteus]
MTAPELPVPAPSRMTTHAPTLAGYATHSPYSDPGRHRALVAALSPDPLAIHRSACAVVVHYRAGDPVLTDEQRTDIDGRWLETTLDRAVARRPGPLVVAREAAQEVAGCCRDHTLFALGVLREHGVPARSRVGFAGYFVPGFHHDHVIAERWDGARWVRFDPELTPGADWDFDVQDVPVGVGSPFETAAEAWRAIRAGAADPSSYGVDPAMPALGGQDFVRDYVLLEVAHRHRDETLLWDLWGPMLSVDLVPRDVLPALGEQPGARIGGPAFDVLVDELAALLVAADAGEGDAADELARHYASDPRLRPRRRVMTLSPSGRAGVTDLEARTTTWLGHAPRTIG